MSTPQEQESNKTVSVENYRYIQSTIAGLILQIRLREHELTLSDLCRVIISETKSMEALGLEYLRDYATGSSLSYKTAEEALKNLEFFKRREAERAEES